MVEVATDGSGKEVIVDGLEGAGDSGGTGVEIAVDISLIAKDVDRDGHKRTIAMVGNGSR